MKPGDICWVSFPNFDGTNTLGNRPVVVLIEGPTGHAHDEVVVVAPITADEDRVANPLDGDISLEHNHVECGLRHPSIIRARQIAALPRNLLRDVSGAVGAEVLSQAQAIAKDLINSGELPLAW